MLLLYLQAAAATPEHSTDSGVAMSQTPEAPPSEALVESLIEEALDEIDREKPLQVKRSSFIAHLKSHIVDSVRVNGKKRWVTV